MATVKGVDALLHELDRAKENLKGVDENIKKLTGRDPTFPRPVSQRRISVGLLGTPGPDFGNGRGRIFSQARRSIEMGDGPALPRKRPGPSGAFNRLGPRVMASSIRGPHTGVDSGDEEDIGHKPAVQSSVVAAPKDMRLREEIIQEQNQDQKGRARNRRMFGLLMGTLQKFKDESTLQTEREKKRKDIEQKLEEKARQEKEELRKETRSLFQERRHNQFKIRRIEHKMELAKEFESWEKETKKMAYSIRTTTTPYIYYRPKKFTNETQKRLKATEQVIQEMIAKRKDQLEEEIERLTQADKENADEEVVGMQLEGEEGTDGDKGAIEGSQEWEEDMDIQSNSEGTHARKEREWEARQMKEGRQAQQMDQTKRNTKADGGTVAIEGGQTQPVDRLENISGHTGEWESTQQHLQMEKEGRDDYHKKNKEVGENGSHSQNKTDRVGDHGEGRNVKDKDHQKVSKKGDKERKKERKYGKGDGKNRKEQDSKGGSTEVADDKSDRNKRHERGSKESRERNKNRKEHKEGQHRSKESKEGKEKETRNKQVKKATEAWETTGQLEFGSDEQHRGLCTSATTLHQQKNIPLPTEMPQPECYVANSNQDAPQISISEILLPVSQAEYEVPVPGKDLAQSQSEPESMVQTETVSAVSVTRSTSKRGRWDQTPNQTPLKQLPVVTESILETLQREQEKKLEKKVISKPGSGGELKGSSGRKQRHSAVSSKSSSNSESSGSSSSSSSERESIRDRGEDPRKLKVVNKEKRKRRSRRDSSSSDSQSDDESKTSNGNMKHSGAKRRKFSRSSSSSSSDVNTSDKLDKGKGDRKTNSTSAKGKQSKTQDKRGIATKQDEEVRHRIAALHEDEEDGEGEVMED